MNDVHGPARNRSRGDTPLRGARHARAGRGARRGLVRAASIVTKIRVGTGQFLTRRFEAKLRYSSPRWYCAFMAARRTLPLVVRPTVPIVASTTSSTYR